MGVWTVENQSVNNAARPSHSSKSVARPLLMWSVASWLLICGCSEPTTALVSGSVSVDGEPAQVGAIAFIPSDNKGTPVGAKISDGEYAAYVPFGKKKVEVRVSKEIGEKRLYETPDSPVKKMMGEALPPRFNSRTELVLDVKPGENRQDYHLKTK